MVYMSRPLYCITNLIHIWPEILCYFDNYLFHILDLCNIAINYS